MLPPAGQDPMGPVSLLLAAFVGLSATFLGWRQWRDRRGRSPDLSPPDRLHFARQDLRRGLGTALLVVLAVALGVGGWMPSRLNGRANLRFVQLWSGVIFLIAILLTLASIDLLATRFYARRRRGQLAREGLEIVEAELRLRIEMERRSRPPGGGLNGSGPH